MDAEGKILEEKTEIPQDREKVEEVLAKFRGEIQQIPPLFSAKKHQGERLYRLARRGEFVERDPISVKVYELELISFEPPFVRFRVFCSKGTYARALCDDIGRALHCGAHLHSLVRLKAGQFLLEEAITLTRLQEIQAQGNLSQVILPIEQALYHLPAVRVLPDSSRSILHGASIALQDIANLPSGLSEGSMVRVLGLRKKLLSLAELTVNTDQIQNLDPRQVILRPVKVFSYR
jgi:tRNA pseudouridine55 synthase